MPAKAKARVAAKTTAKAAPVVSPLNDPWLTPPRSMEERLARIEILGERIEQHVKFMGKVDKLSGTSLEAKERAVTLFYERLFRMEKELAQIQENLQLE